MLVFVFCVYSSIAFLVTIVYFLYIVGYKERHKEKVCFDQDDFMLPIFIGLFWPAFFVFITFNLFHGKICWLGAKVYDFIERIK